MAGPERGSLFADLHQECLDVDAGSKERFRIGVGENRDIALGDEIVDAGPGMSAVEDHETAGLPDGACRPDLDFDHPRIDEKRGRVLERKLSHVAPLEGKVDTAWRFEDSPPSALDQDDARGGDEILPDGDRAHVDVLAASDPRG